MTYNTDKYIIKYISEKYQKTCKPYFFKQKYIELRL